MGRARISVRLRLWKELKEFKQLLIHQETGNPCAMLAIRFIDVSFILFTFKWYHV